MGYTEEDYKHTLRLIYAELVGKANYFKQVFAEDAVGSPERILYYRIKRDAYKSAAAVVKHYCHRLGFDPSKDGGENESLRKESADQAHTERNHEGV